MRRQECSWGLPFESPAPAAPVDPFATLAAAVLRHVRIRCTWGTTAIGSRCTEIRRHEMQHEHTEHVAAGPDAVYAAISEVSNLPSFVPQLTAARQAGDGKGGVDARYEGREQHGEASFQRDDAARRIDWSAASGYHGWMQVDEDGAGSRAAPFLRTPPPRASGTHP